MEIDSSTIKNLRTQRSWTQQHLADACDISLRTVQRIEKIGNASNESVMSLCAVFEIPKKISVLYQRDQVYSCKARILTNITLLCLVGYR